MHLLRSRRVYGNGEDEDGFADEEESIDDVYTEEPGKLPVGSVPYLFLLFFDTFFMQKTKKTCICQKKFVTLRRYSYDI